MRACVRPSWLQGGYLESWSLTSTRTGRVNRMVEGTVTDLTAIRIEGDNVSPGLRTRP